MHKSNELTPTASGTSQQRAGYAEWIALGAVAAGSVGAIVGMATCHRGLERRDETAEREPVAPSTVTAPHGDKLRSAVV